MKGEFLNQEEECEICPQSYSDVAGTCYQSDRPKIDMITQFETNPDFAHYSNVHLTTQNVAKYFDEKSVDFRGFVTRPLSYTDHR
jgi:hypothetical protein